MKETDLFDLDEMGKEVVNFSCFEWLPGMLYVKVPEHNRSTGYINRVCDDLQADRKSTRLNSSHLKLSRMPSSA